MQPPQLHLLFHDPPGLSSLRCGHHIWALPNAAAATAALLGCSVIDEMNIKQAETTAEPFQFLSASRSVRQIRMMTARIVLLGLAVINLADALFIEQR